MSGWVAGEGRGRGGEGKVHTPTTSRTSPRPTTRSRTSGVGKHVIPRLARSRVRKRKERAIRQPRSNLSSRSSRKRRETGGGCVRVGRPLLDRRRDRRFSGLSVTTSMSNFLLRTERIMSLDCLSNCRRWKLLASVGMTSKVLEGVEGFGGRHMWVFLLSSFGALRRAFGRVF